MVETVLRLNAAFREQPSDESFHALMGAISRLVSQLGDGRGPEGGAGDGSDRPWPGPVAGQTLTPLG